MGRQHGHLAAAAVALLAACSGEPGPGDRGGVPRARDLPLYGGPLASAGPDQLVLQGTVVTLDGRASQRGEDLRNPVVRWHQVAGEPVVLDDAGALVTRFLAPPARRESSDSALVFELVLDDGRTTSRDRVNAWVVADASRVRPALVLLGGADQRVAPGASFTLPVRALRFGCPDPDPTNDSFCEVRDGKVVEKPYPYCIEQVEGPPVTIPEGFACDSGFDTSRNPAIRAPQVDRALLTFKIDARASFDVVEDPKDPGIAFANRVRPAPDFVRVRVGGDADGATWCAGSILHEEAEVSNLENKFDHYWRLGPDSATVPPAVLTLTGRKVPSCDPGAQTVLRPLMGAPGILQFGRDTFSWRDWPPERKTSQVEFPVSEWPRFVAVTLETISEDGLWSAPAVSGFHLTIGRGDLDARLPPPSCVATGTCKGTVLLDGSSSPRGEHHEYCWTQNLGPRLLDAATHGLTPGTTVCVEGEPGLTREIRLPPPILGDRSPRVFAFQLQVQSFKLIAQPGGFLKQITGRGLPAAVLFKEVSPDNQLPVAGADGDRLAVELDSIFLDGRCSHDPDEDPVAGSACDLTRLHAYTWSQVPEEGVPAVTDLRPVPCPPAAGVPNLAFPSGTCARATLPRVTTDHTCPEGGPDRCFHFRLDVEDEGGGIGSAIHDVTVLDKLNEPPVAIAVVNTPGGRRTTDAIIVRGGQEILLDPRESFDPNGHLESCRWTYTSAGVQMDLALAGCDAQGNGCLAERLPPLPGEAGVCARERFRVKVPPVSSNVRFQRYVFSLKVADEPPCRFSQGGCRPARDGMPADDAVMDDLTSVTIYALKDGPWVAQGGDPSRALGSPDRPLTTIQEALALARDPELQFDVIHVAHGNYRIDAASGERVLLAGRRVVGSYSYLDGTFTEYRGGPRTVFHTEQGIALRDGIELVHLDVRLDGPGREALDVQEGKVVLDDVRASVDESEADTAYAIHLGGGELTMRGGTASGRLSRGASTGVHCDRGFLLGSGAVLSGGGGTGTHRGLYLGDSCRLDLRDSTVRGVDPGLIARNSEGLKDGIAIGIDGVSLLDVFLAASDPREETCIVQGGRADVAATGARMLRASFNDCVMEGGQAPTRTGLDVRSPGVSACLGVDCVTVHGGRIVGGAGSVTGESRGVWGHGGVQLLDVVSIVGDTGETGGAGKAYGLDLEGGGLVARVPSISGGGPSDDAWGIESGGKPLVIEDSDVLGGTEVSGGAVALHARGDVYLGGASRLRATAGGDQTPEIARGILVAAGGRVQQLSRAGRFGLLVDTGPAADTATGVSSAGVLQLANAIVLAGPAPEVAVVESKGTTRLTSSLLYGVPGSSDLVVLTVLGSAPELRNVILDPGRALSSTRAHLRVVDPGVLPSVLRAVLFAPDPLCATSGGYVQIGARRVCSVSGIEAEGTGYSALVVDPQYADAAGRDFHLSSSSAAVDAGTSEELPLFDADGVARPRGAGPDIGPYEQ